MKEYKLRISRSKADDGFFIVSNGTTEEGMRITELGNYLHNLFRDRTHRMFEVTYYDKIEDRKIAY